MYKPNRYHATVGSGVGVGEIVSFLIIVSFKCRSGAVARPTIALIMDAETALNEPTPAHRDGIPDSSHRLVPQRAKQASPSLHTAQASPHVLYNPRPRRSTPTRTCPRPRTSHQSRRSRSRHRRRARYRLGSAAERAQEHGEGREHDAEEEERRVADVRAE